MQISEDEYDLFHVGVLGMKWGVRRNTARSASRAKASKAYARIGFKGKSASAARSAAKYKAKADLMAKKLKGLEARKAKSKKTPAQKAAIKKRRIAKGKKVAKKALDATGKLALDIAKNEIRSVVSRKVTQAVFGPPKKNK